MANHLLSMSKLHTLISLYVSGKPKRHIALSIGIARNTIDNYLGLKLEKTYHHCLVGMKPLFIA